jgi:hypothetical protein
MRLVEPFDATAGRPTSRRSFCERLRAGPAIIRYERRPMRASAVFHGRVPGFAGLVRGCREPCLANCAKLPGTTPGFPVNHDGIAIG